jgi:hypothetical protein
MVAAFKIRRAAWLTGWVTLPLLGLLVSACGTGTTEAPLPIPTRQIFPTRGPGTPTLPNPRPASSATPTPTPTPVTMKFSFKAICQSGQEIRLRLFDVTDDLIFLDDMHDFIITSSVTPISIACRSGNTICYGGQTSTTTRTPSTPPQPTPTPAMTFGVGLNNDQQCSDCCFECVAGTTVPEIDLSCPSP